jgi:hypothetical protein
VLGGKSPVSGAEQQLRNQFDRKNRIAPAPIES